MKIKIAKKITEWLEITVEAHSTDDAREMERLGKFEEAWDQAKTVKTHYEETRFMSPDDW